MRNSKESKNKHLSIQRKVMTAVLTITTLLVYAMPAYAASNKYAKNFSDWMMDGVRAIVTVAAVVVIALTIINKKFVKLIVTIILAAVILAIVYNPDILKNIGNYVTNIIFN